MYRANARFARAESRDDLTSRSWLFDRHVGGGRPHERL
jgi:hypothetical protein